MPNLDNLTLAGSFIKEIKLITGQLLAINVLRGPVRKGENDVVEEIGLDFQGVDSLKIELKIDPAASSIEIISYSVNQDDNSKPKSDASFTQTGFEQFVINCIEGKIVVIARRFFWSVVDEIPFFAQLGGSKQIPQATPEKQDSSDLQCSFCGRKPAEVPRIVKGHDANICADCVTLCLKILTSPNETDASEQPEDENR